MATSDDLRATHSKLNFSFFFFFYLREKIRENSMHYFFYFFQANLQQQQIQRPNSHRFSSDLSSEADLTTLSSSNGHQRLPPLIHTRPHHNHPQELKRPDSVITTSSIVSSDTASQVRKNTLLLQCISNSIKCYF